MSRVFPYPLLIASLIVMWMLLAGFTPGQFVLGTIVALVGAQAMHALQPSTPRLRRWNLIPKLVFIVMLDIVRSNIAVVRLILREGTSNRRSGFVKIPLDLRDPTGLAVLSVIVTSTPGTAWLDYSEARGILTIHVFDLVDEQDWIDLIKSRYEYILMEIFE